LLDHNYSITLVERDKKENFGGLAKRSFGGIMFVNTPEQKRLRIKDSPDLAFTDWCSYARYQNSDVLPQEWAKEYCGRSIELIYHWLKQKGITFLPVVNWPERGLFTPGNTVPRWHITWGTGHELINRLVAHLRSHRNFHKLRLLFDHRVNTLLTKGDRVIGCKGILEDGSGEFMTHSDITIVASGGICGGDLSLVKKHWPKDFSSPPKSLLNGSHRYADGILHEATQKIGAKLTHLDNQWHYAAGISHPNPKQPNHGLSLVPPRSALWLNALGERIGPVPLVGYTDTRFLVKKICHEPGQYSWQILNWKIAIKELAVSGSEYMTAFRDKKKLRLLWNLVFGNKLLVRRLIEQCSDFVVADNLNELVVRMNVLDTPYKVEYDRLRNAIDRYDSQIERGKRYFNDFQLGCILNARTYRGDRIRTCKFQKISDKRALPLIAIREHILSRKSLGGIQTNLQSQVLDENGKAIGGLYAVGEAAGFGGGGIHGKGSLEGTFLGSCILTARLAGKSIAGKTA